MKKVRKRGSILILFFLVIISIFLINFTLAQDAQNTQEIQGIQSSQDNIQDNSQNSEIQEQQQTQPNNAIPSNIPKVPSDILGEINPQTGKPKNLETLQKYGDYFREKEQNKSFLAREWGIILSNNKYLGPVLFYTDKFFSLFNPLWEVMFGMKFSWSFAFFVGLGLWLLIIFVVYFPGKEIFENRAFGVITGIVVATLTGTSGVIKGAILFASPFIKNIWYLAILIFIVCMIAYVYEEIFKLMKKQSEEEKLKRAKETIIAHGEVSQRAMEEFSGGGGI